MPLVALLAICVIPVQENPVVIGEIQFAPPRGWTKDAEDALWTPSGAESDVFLLWAGPTDAGSEPPEKQFASFHQTMEAKVLKASDPAPLEIPSKLKAATMGRRLEMNQTLLITLELVVVARGKAHYLMFAAGTEERFKELYRKEIQGVLESIKESPAQVVEYEPGTLEGPTREIARFCFRLQVPTSWEEERDNSAYLLRFKRPKTLGEKRSFAQWVVAEIQLGTVRDRRAALESWLVQRLRATTSKEEGKITSRKARQFQEWRLSTGGEGATMCLEEYSGDTYVSDLAGYVFSREGCILFIGSPLGTTREWSGLSKEEREAVEKDFLDLGLQTFAVVSHARFEVPSIQEKWTKWLVQKGTYGWYLKWYSRWGSGSQKMSMSGASSVAWKFHGDQTCEIETHDVAGFTGYNYDPFRPLTLTGMMTGSHFGDEKSDRSRFEVRGNDDKDLWIVVTHPNGLTSFHRIELEAEGEYGKTKPKGLAIDGRIEGKYLNSDDTTDFKNEHYKGWTPLD